MRQRSGLRVWYWALILALFLVPVGGVTLGWFFLSEGWENADQWASIVSAVVALIGGSVALLRWLRGRAATAAAADPDDQEVSAEVMAERLARLAARVRQVWESEELRQRLLDPRPLPVSWRTLGPPVSDHWRVIHGGDEPIDLDGSLDELYDIVRTRLRAPRLVILGEPGAGKSSLIMRFALAWLARRDDDSPVPVILRLSTREPADGKRLTTWIYARLRADYGFHESVSLDRLLPILDGLDEMPEPLRTRTLREINATFGATSPVILTSRSHEYAATIDHPDADVLTAAAVVELNPLDAEAIREYLTITTKPARLPRWERVFGELTRAPDSETARGLSTPLALSLARMTYAEGAEDPDLLLTFRTRHAVEAHLLAHLVPTVYAGRDDLPGPSWGHRDVHSWLSHLARRFPKHGISRESLTDEVPSPAENLIFSSLAGLAAAVAFAVAASPVVGLVLGTTIALVVLVYVFAGDHSLSPVFLSPMTLLTAGGPAAVLFAAVHWYLSAMQGSTAGQAAGLALVTSLWLFVVLSRGVITFIAAVIDFALTLLVTTGPSSPWSLGLAAVLTLVLVTLLENSWVRFLIARVFFTLRGVLPWRVLAFLEDAHRRGVLRKVGGMYYFRHDLLREQLATSADVT
ncbi:NACHT domain-containing protein [Nonomuraea rhodomycinica]|uniref:NACHT domain-containing protein n=1 Tax=Nonomuraea rhodomycinica TaxID=1712872 RepID=A0A7Y6MFD1_9ACTN|nr:NACHT domain-containing protein [Nonomuraea rhodomycinica]NUW44900.1 NACHT domain-containing protein [Nonomuraea rhodomycinica]